MHGGGWVCNLPDAQQVRSNAAADNDKSMRFARQLRGLAPKTELRRGVAVLIGGTTLGQIIIVVSSPVLTRLYTPSDVGVYSVATSILSILIVVSCLRYELAIPLPESDVAAANVLALSLVTTLGTSLTAGVALWIAGPSLLAVFGASILAPVSPADHTRPAGRWSRARTYAVGDSHQDLLGDRCHPPDPEWHPCCRAGWARCPWVSVRPLCSSGLSSGA